MAFVLNCSVTFAAPIDQALQATMDADRRARASQTRVDQLDAESARLLDRYRSAIWETQQLRVYNQQLETLVQPQVAEQAALERQLSEIDSTARDLLPLMLRMVDTLEKFIASDLPFLQQERRERVASLRRLLADPAAKLGEQYQRILEAYQIEDDYSLRLGVERAERDGKVSDVLRIGRSALYALSLDGSEAAAWDAATQKWQPLPRKHLGELRRAVKMARETAAADLLLLPMPAAAVAAPRATP